MWTDNPPILILAIKAYIGIILKGVYKCSYILPLPP